MEAEAVVVVLSIVEALQVVALALIYAAFRVRREDQTLARDTFEAS